MVLWLLCAMGVIIKGFSGFKPPNESVPVIEDYNYVHNIRPKSMPFVRGRPIIM